MKDLYSTKPRERYRISKRLTLEQFIAQHLNPIAYSDARWRAAQADLTAAFKAFVFEKFSYLVDSAQEEKWVRALNFFIDEHYPRILGRTY